MKGCENGSASYLDSKLITAVNKNNCALVKEIIETEGADIEATDMHGRTAIMAAVIRGNWDVANYLLSLKPNLDKVDKYGYSLLHLAIHNNSFACVSLLVYAGVDVTIPDAKGESILFNVCMLHKERSNFKVRDFLFKRFITFFSNHELEKILGCVLEKRDLKTVELLLKYGVYASRFAESICNMFSYSLDWTDFHNAIVENDIKCISDYDLSALFPLAEEDEIYNPLFLANIMGNLHAVKLLLDHGVPANYQLMIKYANRAKQHHLVSFWQDCMNHYDVCSLSSCII